MRKNLRKRFGGHKRTPEPIENCPTGREFYPSAACLNTAQRPRYDTVYRCYPRPVSVDDNALVLDGQRIPVYCVPQPRRAAVV
jgi:hypothetical protein